MMDYDMVEFIVAILKGYRREREKEPLPQDREWVCGEDDGWLLNQEADVAYCDEIIDHLKSIQIMAR